MVNRLEKVAISRFRGGTCPFEVDFDADKAVAIIFGENGTGKSTIADAIAFGLHGDLGCLRFVSVGPRKHKFLNSVGTKSGEMQVAVTVGGETWKARLVKNEPDVTGTHAAPPVHVLRRVELLKLINSEPSKRYDALRGLIDVQRVEASEVELRQAVKESVTAVEHASESQATAEEILTEQWRQSGSAANVTPLQWAREAATADLPTLKKRIEDSRGFLAAHGDATNALNTLQASVADASDAAATLRDFRNRLETIQGEDDALLIDVLESAKRVLYPASKQCPVCEQAIVGEALRQHIEERLSTLKEVRDWKIEIDKASKNSEMKESMREQHQTVLESRLSELAMRAAALRGRFQDLPIGPDAPNNAQISTYLSDLGAYRQRIQDAVDADEKTQHQQSVLATNVKAVDEAKQRLVHLQSKAKRLEQISAVFESVRKAYVNEVLIEISGSAARMYARLHPEEAVGSLSLSLKDATSASLELTGSFGGEKDIPPQAYYSESHLDTLGLCVFLAMAMRDTDPIVILDDVFTSVDDAHLGRTLELLHDEAKNVGHLIITTHYRAWRDRYKYARGPVAQTQLIELLPWAHNLGIRHAKTRPSVNELRENLAKEPLDRIGVAARAGILLEALLDDLTLRYHCRMPRAAELNYTLGELFGGIDSKLQRALRVAKPNGETALQPLIEKLSSMSFLRNKVGAHFNLSGSNISDIEVRSFAETTLAFADTVVCENCGELPRREKTGGSWQCTCGSTRLIPLLKPGDKAA